MCKLSVLLISTISVLAFVTNARADTIHPQGLWGDTITSATSATPATSAATPKRNTNNRKNK